MTRARPGRRVYRNPASGRMYSDPYREQRLQRARSQQLAWRQRNRGHVIEVRGRQNTERALAFLIGLGNMFTTLQRRQRGEH